MFIVDADILIRAKRTYYQFQRVPQFWEWLEYQAQVGTVKMAVETWEKVGDKTRERRDDLAVWVNDHKDNLILQDRSYDSCFSHVLAQYEWPNGTNLSEADLLTIGDDYQMIACALHNNATVVTNETSTKSIGPNRKVPNVCDALGVECIDLDGLKGVPGLVDRLDFRTNWNE